VVWSYGAWICSETGRPDERSSPSTIDCCATALIAATPVSAVTAMATPIRLISTRARWVRNSDHASISEP